MRSKELGLWLRQIGEGDAARVRPASGKDGEILMPTPEEREQVEREAKEREREARLLAEHEVAKLREEIVRLRRATTSAKPRAPSAARKGRRRSP